MVVDENTNFSLHLQIYLSFGFGQLPLQTVSIYGNPRESNDGKIMPLTSGER